MKASTRPVASGSSALLFVMCSMPRLVRYCWSKWLSLPLKGAPLSECRYFGSPCLLNTSAKAWMLASAEVPLTTMASG